jgi:inhibitor of the pro-sigma K processing machinery
MVSLIPDGPWLSLFILALLLAVIFRRTLWKLAKLLLRSLLWLAGLALWSKSGLLAGLALGVNPFNALVLGILGLPGLGVLVAAKAWLP